MGQGIVLQPTPLTWEVFLSSTIQDFSVYRRAVQEVLLKEAQTPCFLSEDWVGGYDDTVQKCRDKVNQASAFFLLLGYWYGSIPPRSQKSITHMEFDWALEKWGQHKYPPVAVLEPDPQEGTADKELRDTAENLLPKRKDQRKKHDAQLKAFHAEVKDTWKTVYRFKNKDHLLQKILVRCGLWRGYTPIAAARSKVPAEETTRSDLRPTDEELGLLGRKKQLDAVDDLMVEISAYPEVPALALLVYGDEDAGQRAFLHRLTKAKTFRRSRPARPGRPPLDHYDLAVLIQWVAKELGLSDGDEVKTPQDLADRVSGELKRQSLYFILDQVHRFPGGVTAFQGGFWRPFYERLKELRAQQQIGYRLIAIVVDYTGDAEAWQSATCGPDFAVSLVDYTKLFLIPKLTGFTKHDVLRWLSDLNVEDDSSGKLARLADRVLSNMKGELDPTPLRVFERLRRENLWPEDEDE